MNQGFSTDHNSFLKGVFDRIIKEGFTDELMGMLEIELKHANVTNPTYNDSPAYMKVDGKYYLLLFSRHGEFIEAFPEFCAHTHFSFDWYMEAISNPVESYIDWNTQEFGSTSEICFAEGIIFNPETENIIIEGEPLSRLRKFFKINLFTYCELREMFDSVDNARLDELLMESPHDWDEIIKEMGSATLLATVRVEKVEDMGEIGSFINSMKLNPLKSKKSQEIYTSKNFTLGEDEHVILVSLMEVAEAVLSFGLTGLTVVSPQCEVFMSRQLLIEKYAMIEEHCNDERFEKAYNFMFDLEE